MRVGIVQPNFLPWRGYFDFIASVDVFVLYDDVPLGGRRSWRNRNRIRCESGSRWLTVPLMKGQSGTPILDVQIATERDWSRRLTHVLRSSYDSAPHSFELVPFADTLASGHSSLADLNITLIRLMMDALAVDTELIRASDLAVPPMSKEIRPLEIVKRLEGDEYLMGPTAAPYTPLAPYLDAGIGVLEKVYDYQSYEQPWPGFDPHVSALDLLLSVGSGEARRLFRSQTSAQVLTI